MKEKAAELRNDFGDEGRARTLEWAATQLANILADAENEPLHLKEAALQSGYSTDHLARLIRQGKLPNAGRPNAPKLRRIDVPQKPRPLLNSTESAMVQPKAKIVRSLVNP